MIYDRQKVSTLYEDLQPYIQAEGSELGEVGKHILGILGFPDYVSEEYLEATLKEAEDMLKELKDEFVWKTRTITPAPYEVRELVRKDWYEYD